MTQYHRRVSFLVAVAASSVCSVASAAIIDDFQFNEPNQTVITAAVNSANPGNGWLSQNTAINADVQDGSFQIRKGGEVAPVTGQVGNTLDIPTVSSGKIWLVADIPRWMYSETPSTPSERVRFGFLDNDVPAANSSTVTAGFNIDRLPNNNLTITGEAGGSGATGTIMGGPDLSRFRAPREGDVPLRIVLEVDADADTYTISYKDGSAPYASLPTGNLGERSAGVLREARSVRFAFTGTYSETGEFVDVDRIFVTTTNPIPEPAGLMLLGVGACGLAAFRRR